jgi:hypothetical protein
MMQIPISAEDGPKLRQGAGATADIGLAVKHQVTHATLIGPRLPTEHDVIGSTG